MKHSSIAALSLEKMPASVQQKRWWAQSTEIAYGQYDGLRVPGQTSAGDFQLSASRTVIVTQDETRQAALYLVENRSDFGGVPVDDEASTSSKAIKHWRAKRKDLLAQLEGNTHVASGPDD